MTSRPDNNDVTIHRTPDARCAPWPRAVAWLAVAAHFCIADVIGVNSRGSKDDLIVVRDAAVLLAQADLIVVWLVLGGTRWIRRLPWSLCGLSGIGLVLYMHNFNQVMGVVSAAYVAHLVTTAAAVGLLRLRRVRIVRATDTKGEAARVSRAFTIGDLLGAALGTAIAVSWLLRMEKPPVLDADGVLAMFVMAAPLSGLTLIAASGMRYERSLVIQIVLAALATVYLAVPAYGMDKRLWSLYLTSWLIVAATLWIFQMCGFRLVKAVKCLGSL